MAASCLTPVSEEMSTFLAIWNVLESESEPRSATMTSLDFDFRGMVISGAWMEISSFIR